MANLSYFNRISHQVTRWQGVLWKIIIVKVEALPVVVAHLLDPLCAGESSRELEDFLPGLEVFGPEGHPEHVHVSIGVIAGVVGLPATYCYLSVPGP